MIQYKRFHRKEVASQIQDSLFSEQKNFIEDESKNKAGVCSRRAGKTYCCCAYLVIKGLERSGAKVLYIGLTKPTAGLIIWDELKKMNLTFRIGMRFNDTKLQARLSNGSLIIIGGADTKNEVEKYRGLAYDLVILDECGSFKTHITQLIEQSLEPAMIDFQGIMVMIGTPNASATGYFHDKTTGNFTGWSVHHWTLEQNPFIRDKNGEHEQYVKNYLENERKKHGWTEQTPRWLREWKGQWIRDEESLVYHYSKNKNDCQEMPRIHEKMHVLGVDLGYSDSTAIVVMACSKTQKDVFVVECWKKNKIGVTEIVAKIKNLQEKYGQFIKIVVDSGGLGKMIVEEMRSRHQLPLSSAEKTKKRDHIELFNDDLETGKIKVVESECQELIDEWNLAVWGDEDYLKEDERNENHLSDACLYAWRECLHWAYRPVAEIPKKGSMEALLREEQRMEAQIEQKNKKQSTWWEK